MRTSEITKDMVLIFIVEGDPHVGYLKRWADATVDAHYGGFDVSDRVWIVDNSTGATFTNHKPEVVSESEADDFQYVTYRLGEQEATVRVDLRA